MFIITTAGFNKNGACYAYRENVIKILRGINQDDTLFGIIYTLDSKEEWDNPRCGSSPIPTSVCPSRWTILPTRCRTRRTVRRPSAM